MAFLEGDNFEDVIRKAISVGGDSDTIAAMAGGIAEAFYGIPEDIQRKAEYALRDRTDRGGQYNNSALLREVRNFQEFRRNMCGNNRFNPVTRI